MRVVQVVGVALVAAAVGCNSTTGYGSGGGGGPGPNQVFMQNIAFNPTSLTVSKGTTVEWMNKDGVTHTVTKVSGPGASFNQSVASGSNVSVTFDSTGTIQYHCTIHAGMNGTIVVQ